MDKVSQAFITFYESEIGDVGVWTDGHIAPAVVRSAVERCVEGRLSGLVPRVFVVEFHEFRESLGLPVDENSSVASLQYLKEFGADEVARWREKYPVFGALVDGVVDQSVAHVREICQRYVADRPALEAAGLLAPDARLDEIQHLASDSHNRGRMVAALRHSGGARVIYKPRSLGPEVLVGTCLKRLSPHVGLDLERCAPQSLDRGTHGWQRDVVRVAATSEDDARRYYRTFGAVAALMGALGASDMHHENLIAVGDHPVVVDLETALQAHVHPLTGDLAGALISRVTGSLANTLLLPQRLPSGPYSVLLGGIGVPYEQLSERTDFMMVNRDTDAVDIARRTFPHSQEANLLERADGSATDVLDYYSDFLVGLRLGHRAVELEREGLVADIDAHPVQVRQIFRATANYARILNAATHPDNLRSREQFDRIIGMLRPPMGLDRPVLREFILDAEKVALSGGDIPYFAVHTDDVRLQVDGLTSVPFCDRSPRDRAKGGLLLAGEAALPFEELMVEEGFSELRTVRFKNDTSYRPGGSGPFHQCFGPEGVDWAEAVERLRGVAVEARTVDGDELGWVGGSDSPGMATYDPGTRVSLHDAGGMHILFERLATFGSESDQDYLTRVRRGLISLRRRYREGLEGAPLSVASGAASLDYVLAPDAGRLPAAESALTDALSSGVEVRSGDLMMGLPGLGLLLASYPETPQGVLRQTLSAISTSTEHVKGPWDLAHGGVGLTWARYRLLSSIGAHDEARALGREFVGGFNELPELAPAWCAGYAGILMVAAELGSDVEDPTQLVSLATKATSLPAVGQAVDLSVCHGAAGVVQSLVQLAQRRGEAWPLELAHEYWARVGKHAVDEGFFTGAPEKQALLGYFLGWSGIADTGLQLNCALEGHSVWVPLAFARRVDAGGSK